MDFDEIKSAKKALSKELGFFTENCVIPEMCGIGIRKKGNDYVINILLECEIPETVKQQYSSYKGIAVTFEVTGIATAYEQDGF